MLSAETANFGLVPHPIMYQCYLRFRSSGRERKGDGVTMMSFPEDSGPKLRPMCF
jgi:hypothetical protein